MARTKPISDQLRDAIERSGLSWYAIAGETGIDKATIGRFMKGTHDLAPHNIDRLGEFFGIKITVTKPTGTLAKPAKRKQKG